MKCASRRWCGCLVLAVAASTNIVPVAAQDVPPPQQLIDAERFAATGDWDQAIAVLTELVQRLEAVPRDVGTGRLLITAYEKRGLARLQTGDRSNATIDFIALLQIDPNYAFATPSPGIMSFFEDTRKSTLASLDLTVSPDDAIIVLEKERLIFRWQLTRPNHHANRLPVVDGWFLSHDGPQTRVRNPDRRARSPSRQSAPPPGRTEANVCRVVHPDDPLRSEREH